MNLALIPSALVAVLIGFAILIIAVAAWLRFKSWHAPVIVLLGSIAAAYPFVEPGNILPLLATVAMVPIWTTWRNSLGASYATPREALSHLGTALARVFGSLADAGRGLLADLPGFWRRRGFWKVLGFVLAALFVVSLVKSMLGDDHWQYVVSALWLLASVPLFAATLRLFVDGSGTVSLTRMFDGDRALGLAKVMKKTKATVEMNGRLYTYSPNPLVAVGVDDDVAFTVLDGYDMELVVFEAGMLRFEVRGNYASEPEVQDFADEEDNFDSVSTRVISPDEVEL